MIPIQNMPFPQSAARDFPDHLRESRVGARDPAHHQRLTDRLAALDDRWASLERADAPLDAHTLHADICARHELLQDAARDSDFSARGQMLERADVLRLAAGRQRAHAPGPCPALLAWRDEMLALLRMAVDEGREGRWVTGAEAAVPQIRAALPRHLIEAFWEVEAQRLTLGDSRPGHAGHAALCQAAALLDGLDAMDLQDPDAFVRYRDLLQRVRAIEMRAIADADADADAAGAGSPVLDDLRIRLSDTGT